MLHTGPAQKLLCSQGRSPICRLQPRGNGSADQRPRNTEEPRRIQNFVDGGLGVCGEGIGEKALKLWRRSGKVASAGRWSGAMSRVEMTLIRRSRKESRPVLKAAFAAPIVQGQGDATFLCGACCAPVLVNVEWSEFTGFVVECWKCRERNEVPLSNRHIR